MEPMLAQTCGKNFELLYARREMLPLVVRIAPVYLKPHYGRKPEEAREASHAAIWRL